MRRALAGITALLLVVAAAPAGAGAATNAPLRLTSLDVPFPARAYVLTFPSGRQLTTTQVQVTENGQPVRNVQVVPESLDQKATFGVVLLIDSSLSMRGAPIQAAAAAARAFDAHRSSNEKIAVIDFNRTARVAVPLTADESVIQPALASPPQLRLGTHINDSVVAALHLLDNGHVSGGTIVVLSDGADTGSKIAASAAARLATAQQVRIFTVGLHSPDFSPRTLRALADGSDGSFAEASSSTQLTPIYAALSARLASQYVIHYQSLLGPNQAAHVRVQVADASSVATAAYRTPGLPAHAPEAYKPPVLTTFFGSVGGMLLVVLLAAGLIGGAIALALRPRQRTVRARVGEFVTVKGPEGDDRERFALRVFGGVERPLENVGRWTKFKDNLEIAGIAMPAIQIVLWTLTATVAVAFLIAAATGSLVLPLIAFVIPFAVYESISRRLKKVRKAFAEQLPDNLQVLASALRAGHSFVGALAVVVDDCEEPARTELRRVVADEQLGVPLEDALDSVVRRMDNRDLGQVALVASLQRQTGGNSAEVIDRVTETVRERFELRRLVQTLTAQGRMSRWIVSGLPVVLLLAFLVISPTYLAPLFHQTVGQVLLTLAFVFVVIGSIVIGRIVDIEV